MNPSQAPNKKTLYTATALAATAAGTAVDVPISDSYTIYADVAAGTGTSPTLDLAIQHSFDGGTTYYTFAKLTQITTAAKAYQISIRNGLAMGEAATEQATALTGSAYVKNTNLGTKWRVYATVGGTNPAFATVTVFVVPMPNGGV